MDRSAWTRARRILCVRLDGAGDLLMSVPAIRALREAAADRHVTLLCSPAAAAAAELVPAIDELIVYEAPWVKATAPDAPAAHDLAMVGRLRSGRFDAAAIFTVATQSPLPAALMLRMAGVPLRLAHARERAYGLLTDAVRETEGRVATRHEVRRQLDLVAAVGARPAHERLGPLALPGEADRLGAMLAGAGVERSAPYVVVHPGASAPSRRYPLERFAEAAALIARRAQLPVLVVAGASEMALAADVARMAGHDVVALPGALGFGELALLVAGAALLVANNSAPAHLAAATGTPVTVAYALTNPQHTPWQVPSRVVNMDVPCRWCLASVCPERHHLCLRGVGAAELAEHALELLSESAVAPRAPERV